MDRESAEPFEFNPYTPEYNVNPHPTCQYLRKWAPIYRWSAAQAWVLSRYDDVVAMMRDRRLSVDSTYWEYAPPTSQHAEYEMVAKNSPFRLSEQDHTRVRKVVSPAFTPRAIERFRADLQRIVDESLESALRGDTIDIARDFAEHIPLRAISSLLRLPSEQDSLFRRFSTAIIDSSNPMLAPAEFAEIITPVPEGIAMLREIIEERRKNPGDDVLSTLIHAEEQGEKITRDEIIGLVTGLIAAGSETTVHLICFTVLNLLRYPEQLQIVRDEPALLKNALDEVLRFDNFSKIGVARFAKEDIEIRGTAIRKGQLVFPLLSSALRDPDIFPDPDRFDVRRDQSRNVAFGSGPHYCIGAALARLEGEVAVGTLLRRFPHMQLAGEPSFAPHAFLRKIGSLPISVRPRSDPRTR